MLTKIKKISVFILRRIQAKKIWRRPIKSDVLIFDACGQECLFEFLSPWKPEILHVRGEQINIFILLISLLRIGKRREAYVDCFIEQVQPRLIVTFIDNNPFFYTISKRHSKIKTLFIQNGWRGYYADVFESLDNMQLDSRDKLKVDHMMTFGSTSGSEYAKYISGSITPVGSVKSNSLKKKQIVENNVIAFVSQWQNDGFFMGGKFYSHVDFFKQADYPVVKCLDRYATKFKKKLLIIPRHSIYDELRSQEEIYYSEILGYLPDFVKQEGKDSSYKAIDSSEVVVTIDSTLGYESIARGRKTAFFSIRSNMLNIPGFTYGWPKKFTNEGLFWTNSLNIDSFNRILDYLFSINNEQWKKDIVDSGFSSLMISDLDNKIFKSVIEEELGSTPI